VIYSAISDDGIHFVKEDGIRLAGPGGAPTGDPMVLLTANGWRMWSWDWRLQFRRTHTATSEDGLHFTPAGRFEVEGREFMTWAALAVPGGGYRIYGNFMGPGNGDIVSAFSLDGVSWRAEPGVRLSRQGGDPSLEGVWRSAAADCGVAAKPDGNYLMAYLAMIP